MKINAVQQLALLTPNIDLRKTIWENGQEMWSTQDVYAAGIQMLQKAA